MDDAFLLLSFGQGRHRITARALACGTDLLVSFTGGDTPHIGACATAVPRPSLRPGGPPSASASVLCVSGHKEDLPARQAALALASACGRVVCVCAGFHVDDASPADIELLQTNFTSLLEALTNACRDWPSLRPPTGGRP